MRIGVPKEIKNNEFRVGLVPAGAEVLVGDGHEVVVEQGAGLGSGIADDDYIQAGASIAGDAGAAWDVDMVIKVKEPLPEEFGYLQPGQLLFCFLHLAGAPQVLDELLKRSVRAIGYETVQPEGGGLPLLAPMSQVAGKMAVQLGAAFLQREKGGSGILLGGVPGTKHGRIVIIGGGNVGINAAKVAYGLGAQVVIIDSDHGRLSYIDDIFDGKVVTLTSNAINIREALPNCDMLVGAALIPGARAPQLLTRQMLRTMRPGSVFVDVAIDQGGMSETSRLTCHAEPVYVEEGIIHYCVPNIPGSVPVTSTYALTNVTASYVCKLAAADIREALKANVALIRGVNTWDGHLTCPAVAAAFDMPCTPLEALIAT